MMTAKEILNIRLDAKSLAVIQTWLKESEKRETRTGVDKRHELISIRDLIKICSIKLVNRKEHLEKMKSLAACREIYNMKELSGKLDISRQTHTNVAIQ